MVGKKEKVGLKMRDRSPLCPSVRPSIRPPTRPPFFLAHKGGLLKGGFVHRLGFMDLTVQSFVAIILPFPY